MSFKKSMALLILCLAAGCTDQKSEVEEYLEKISADDPAVAKEAYVGGAIYKASIEYKPKTVQEVEVLGDAIVDTRRTYSVRMNCYFCVDGSKDEKMKAHLRN
jgi:hypothetical protein